MQSRRLLLFALLLSLLPARAEEIVFNQHGCSVTLPSGWKRGVGQKIPTGDIVLHATRQESNQLFVLVVLPNLPTDDVEAPGVATRIQETLSSFGYQTAGPPEVRPWNGMKYVQFIAKRPDSASGGLVAVTRAFLKENKVYMLTTIGRGDSEKARDPLFMQLIDSFQFVEPAAVEKPPTEDPLFGTYRLGFFACTITIAILVTLYICMLLATRRRAYR
jgi:hypothetical protein